MANHICAKCGGLRDGPHKSYCRACFRIYNAERMRRWRLDNPEKAKAADRRNHETRDRAKAKMYERKGALKRQYRMTPAEYDALFAAQGHGCGICKTTIPGGSGLFHVDHDHSCCPGKKTCGECIRGLLCQACNLGQRWDTPGWLDAARRYLEQTTAIREKADNQTRLFVLRKSR